MKTRFTIFFAVFLLRISLVLCQTPPPGQNTKNQSEKEKCHQNLMQSYLLKGVEQSNNRTMFLCPTIKKNCCTRHDMQRVFHFVRDIVPAKLQDYDQKIDILLMQIREIHIQMVKTPPTFVGFRRRRQFCARQYRKVIAVDFQQLYNKILENSMLAKYFLQDHYQKFFCMMCDANAHLNMVFRENKQNVSFDISYCEDIIKENKELIRLFNVELMEYFRTMQNVVDCVHYSRSYHLRFFRRDKVIQMNQIKGCLEDLQGPRFQQVCGKVCHYINMSQIVPMLQGDFDFLHEVVLVFNRFLKYRESGNLISLRLRNFFRRFRLPKRLMRTRRTNFVRNIVFRPPKNKGKARSLVDEDSHQKPSKELQLIDKTTLKKYAKKNRSNVKKYSILKPKKSSKKTSRSLTLKSVGLNHSNIPQKLKTGRFLQDGPDPNFVVQRKGRAKMTRLVRNPLPMFDSVLVEFYHEIEIPMVEEPRPTIYRIRANPIFFEKMEKTWIEDGGINMNSYTKLRFNMSRRAFYRILFTYRKPEIPDSTLTMFLMDFTKDFFNKADRLFEIDYAISANNYMPKIETAMEIDDDRRRKLMHKKQSKTKTKSTFRRRKLKNG